MPDESEPHQPTIISTQMDTETKITKILERLWFENNLQVHDKGQRMYLARISTDWSDYRLAVTPDNLIKIGEWLTEEEIALLTSIWPEDNSVMIFYPPVKQDDKKRDEFTEKIIEKGLIGEDEFKEIILDHMQFVNAQFRNSDQSFLKIIQKTVDKCTEVLNTLKSIQTLRSSIPSTSKPKIKDIKVVNETEKVSENKFSPCSNDDRKLEHKTSNKAKSRTELILEKSKRKIVDVRNPDIVETIRSKPDLSRIDISTESNNTVTGKSIRKTVKRNREIGVRTCFSCGQNGHMSNDCPNPGSIHCYRCNKLGNHIARDCKEKSNSNIEFHNEPAVKRVRFSFPSGEKIGMNGEINKNQNFKRRSAYANTESFKTSGLGSLKLLSSTANKLDLENISYSESLFKNLRKCVENGFQIYVDDKEINIVDPTTREKVKPGIYKSTSWTIPLNDYPDNETENKNTYRFLRDKQFKGHNSRQKWNH